MLLMQCSRLKENLLQKNKKLDCGMWFHTLKQNLFFCSYILFFFLKKKIHKEIDRTNIACFSSKLSYQPILPTEKIYYCLMFCYAVTSIMWVGSKMNMWQVPKSGKTWAAFPLKLPITICPRPVAVCGYIWKLKNAVFGGPM